MIETRTPRLALLCDRAGVIQKILCDDFFAAGMLLRGQVFAEWVDPGSRDKVSHLLAEVNAQGSAFDWELNIAPQGKLITLHFSGFANDASVLIVGDHNRNDILQLQEESMRINNELVNTLRATIKDQTERKQVENELRKLSQAVEQSPASIVITDLDGNIEYVNTRFTQITGYGFNEVIGKNPRILKTDLTPPETHRQLWETIKAGKEWHGEFVNHKKDDALYYESAAISPITDLNGVATHYLAVKEDITERKQIEQSLNDMRSRLQLLGDNLEEAALYVYSYDTDNQPHFEYLSAGMERLTGVKSEDALQDASRLHDLILPEYISRLVELEAKSKEDLTSFEMEIRQRNAITDNIHWALLRSTPRRRPDGSTVWYGVQMDITKRKRNEKLLEEANGQLRVDMEKIEQLQAELREQAIRDPLTGLFNRRYLDETLARELARAERDNTPLSMIMSDIDNFKIINDTYGHPVGDKFLLAIASMMKNHVRDSDIVCRYGGEEFLLVLPGSAPKSAEKRAEEIRQKCAEVIIQHEGKDLKVTTSFGVAAYPNHGKDAEEIIIKADKALYQSKQSGRNRVTVWDEEAGR